MVIGKIDVVKDYIIKEIKLGRIKKGQRLPSCRKLSSQLSINKITINKAYNELEKEHKVYSIPRGGFYLIDSEEDIKVVENKVDFSTVRPDERLIPYREFTHVMNKAVDMYKNTLFEYEITGGLKSLRDTLSSEFKKDGVYTSSENIIITHGAQQAIGLVFQYLSKSKKRKLLVEAPTYNLALKLGNHLGLDIIGIRRDKDGFDYKEMERIFKTGEISAFYIIPRHHNPTGYTLSEKDKEKIAKLSLKYNVLIIEDDYLADLGSKKGSMPIHYYDINKDTVYIRSFSKAFMPGIRMGAVVLPHFMIKEIMVLKHISDLNTSKIPQAALDLFIKSGMYEKHIRKVKRSYDAKLKKAVEIFKALCIDDFYLHIPKHGIFIWIELPNRIKSKDIEKRLKGHNIFVKSASEFFPVKWVNEKNITTDNYIRLCISGIMEKQLDALATIISEIRKS